MSSKKIYWQAHRGGGGNEAPDNTIFSINYGWNLGGIPEVDIRLTADDKLICLHDDTLARTTDAPPDRANLRIRDITYDEIRQYDAGSRFSEANRGEKIPAMQEVLALLYENPERMIYADIKNYDPEIFPLLLGKFTNLVNEYNVAAQIIACSCDYNLNCQLHENIPGILTMQWIGGNPEQKLEQFTKLADKKFAGLQQVQLHLDLNNEPAQGSFFDISPNELAEALKITEQNGISLQVFPWTFTREAIFSLLDAGIRWYVTDEPGRFCRIINEWQDEND
jgi:glycerophosphoryl diester phosphodiesterase